MKKCQSPCVINIIYTNWVLSGLQLRKSTSRNLIWFIPLFIFFVLFSLDCFSLFFFVWVWMFHCRVGIMLWFTMSCQTIFSNYWIIVGIFLLAVQFRLSFLVHHFPTLFIWRQAEHWSIWVQFAYTGGIVDHHCLSFHLTRIKKRRYEI